MKRRPNANDIERSPAFQLDPALNADETIILRALGAGHTDRQVCNELRMNPDKYLRMMLDMREKIGKPDNVSLIAWAKERIQGADQRIDIANGRSRFA